MSFLFLVSVVLFLVRSRCVFFFLPSNHFARHNLCRKQNESMHSLMFWGPADRISSPTEKKMPKQLQESVHSDRFCRVQNLPTSSVGLIWPITELYFRQILSTDFMNRFYQDVNTGPKDVIIPDKLFWIPVRERIFQRQLSFLSIH